MQSEADKLVREASNAHSRLNTFYAVIAILEGGCLPGGSESAHEAAQKIIKICQRASDHELRTYDEARASIRSLIPAQPEAKEADRHDA